MNKVAIIGTGSVAQHLCAIIYEKGIPISCIASRNLNKAEQLAKKFGTEACFIDGIKNDSEFVIIAISDDAIAGVVKQIPIGNYIVAHTSGSVSIKVFGEKFENFGVFYPLQSFTKERKVDFNEIPVLVEANTSVNAEKLSSLALKLSSRVEIMNSEQRKNLHLAAVIANNFVNFMAIQSYEYLEKNNIDGTLIQPLLKETVLRLSGFHPRNMQTGPAKRNDEKVIEKHLKMLDSNPKLQSLYRQISQLINEYYGR